MPLFSLRTRLVWAALSCSAFAAAAIACSAIVGVEDVTLAHPKDGPDPGDDGDIGQDDSSVTDAPPPGVEASVQLAAGLIHTCARKTAEGKVRCWGDNGAGQIGDGISFDAGARPSVLVPQEVVGLGDATYVACGGAFTCAIRKGGTVACWGVNTFGQLGDGTTDRSSSPVAVKNITNAIGLATGTSFACALISGGTVQCWGANYAGQLGDNTKLDHGNAAPVQQLTGAVAITAAERHACAIVQNGGVKCWGQNDEGQLGTGNTTESLLPAALGSLTDVVQVAAASRFTCARLKSGQVNCWGANTLGQLGTGSPNVAPNPSPAITNVNDAISIWVGYEHACAVRKTGNVVCWGEAGEGQIGSGSVPDDASIPQPTMVVGISSALGVSTGGSHSCATTTTGAVFCWGENSLGELGNGTTDLSYAAVPVTGFP